MKFTTTAAIALSSYVASANAYYYGLIASHSGSAIHLQEINAHKGGFWIGKSTTSYCPSSVGSACPKGKVTDFTGGAGSLSLGVVVPGGQQVYADGTTGALAFTAPHSASTPDGAILDGWSVTPKTSADSSFGELAFKYGLYACASDEDSGPWRVYAAVPGTSIASVGCIAFDALTVNVTKAKAWEYE